MSTTEPHAPELLFTENETNTERLFGVPNASPYVKDAFHEAWSAGRQTVSIPTREGPRPRRITARIVAGRLR